MKSSVAMECLVPRIIYILKFFDSKKINKNNCSFVKGSSKLLCLKLMWFYVEKKFKVLTLYKKYHIINLSFKIN